MADEVCHRRYSVGQHAEDLVATLAVQHRAARHRLDQGDVARYRGWPDDTISNQVPSGERSDEVKITVGNHDAVPLVNTQVSDHEFLPSILFGLTDVGEDPRDGHRVGEPFSSSDVSGDGQHQ